MQAQGWSSQDVRTESGSRSGGFEVHTDHVRSAALELPADSGRHM